MKLLTSSCNDDKRVSSPPKDWDCWAKDSGMPLTMLPAFPPKGSLLRRSWTPVTLSLRLLRKEAPLLAAPAPSPRRGLAASPVIPAAAIPSVVRPTAPTAVVLCSPSLRNKAKVEATLPRACVTCPASTLRFTLRFCVSFRCLPKLDTLVDVVSTAFAVAASSR